MSLIAHDRTTLTEVLAGVKAAIDTYETQLDRHGSLVASGYLMGLTKALGIIMDIDDQHSTAIDHIRALHHIVLGEDVRANPFDYCNECEPQYPCKTIALLDGQL